MSPLTLNAQQDVCPCIHSSTMWVSTVCDSWNCAMAALINANGDPTVFAMPLATKDVRWLVVRRVQSGGYINDSPFQVESFDGVAEAGARYAAMSADFKPHMMTAPDGKFLVISLRQPENDTRRRSVGH